MLNPDHNASPFNTVPAIVVILTAAMAAIEIGVQAGASGLVGGPQAIGWRAQLLESYSFSAPLFEWMLAEPGRIRPDILIRLVSYPFVHVSFGHMLFAAVITLALGKFVGEVFRQWAVLAIWVASSIAAALLFTLLTDTNEPLYGGMAPAYGLIGAYTFVLWQKARITGQPAWMAFRLIGLLILLQLLFSAMQGGLGTQIVAELSAFAAGFAISFVVRPGGLRALVGDLRRR